MPTTTEQRQQWEERYRSGPLPWDTGITPPEVQSFWASGRLPKRGLALDLGCGTGTNVAYLARQGLTVVGVEHAGLALARALMRRRISTAAARLRQEFVQADVARLPFSNSQAVYVLDIGCLHAVPDQDRRAYAAGVIDNLAPGGYYHLYAMDCMEEPGGDPSAERRGMGEDEVAVLFSPHLSILEEIRATPQPRPCRWYLLHRPA